MSRARAAIRARRDRLIAQAALQRDEITRDFDALKGVFTAADRVMSVVTFLKRGGPDPAIGDSSLALLRWPLRGVRWFLNARRAWRAARVILAVLH